MTTGLKFMGKDPNGLAKAVGVDNDGSLLKTKSQTLYAYTSSAITIDASSGYLSGKFTRDGYSFFRLVINFANGTDVTTGVDVYVLGKPKDLTTDGTAAGYIYKIPTIVGAVATASLTAKSVMLSDGDIPMYEYDLYIYIVNNKTGSVSLRNIEIIRMG